MNSKKQGLWRQPDFLRLWVGQTISIFGTRMTALPLAAILVLHATPAQMGLLSAAGFAPLLLFGLAAGIWVDRLHRRPLLIAADLGRAALLLSIPVAAWRGTLAMPQLYVVSALVGILSVVFDIAYPSYLPSLIPRDQLVEGNSKLMMSASVAEIAGPSTGGTLVQLLGAVRMVLIDAFTFLVSAACLFLIRTPEPPPAPTEERGSIRQDVLDGLHEIFRQPLLRALLIGTGSLTFFGGFYMAFYSFYGLRVLHLSPALLGVVISTGGISALVGSVLAEPAARRYGTGKALTTSILIGAVGQVFLPLAMGPTAVVAAMMVTSQLFGDCFGVIFEVHEKSLRQLLLPARFLGRVNASFQVIVGSAGSLGALLAGALGEEIGVRQTLGIGTLGIILAAVYLFCSPLRQFREEDIVLPEQAMEDDIKASAVQ